MIRNFTKHSASKAKTSGRLMGVAPSQNNSSVASSQSISSSLSNANSTWNHVTTAKTTSVLNQAAYHTSHFSRNYPSNNNENDDNDDNRYPKRDQEEDEDDDDNEEPEIERIDVEHDEDEYDEDMEARDDDDPEENHEEHDIDHDDGEHDPDEDGEQDDNNDEHSRFVEPEELIVDSAPESALVSGNQRNGNNTTTAFLNVPTPKSVVVLPVFKRPAFPETFMPFTLTVKQGWLVQMMNKGRYPMFGLFYAKPKKVKTKPASSEKEESKEGEKKPEEGKKSSKKEESSDSTDERARDVTSVDELYEVGCLARVAQYQQTKDGAYMILGCIRRIRITEQVDVPEEAASKMPEETSGKKKGHQMGIIARIEDFEDKNADRKSDPTMRALMMETMLSLRELSKAQTFYKEQLKLFMETMDLQNPAGMADVASILLSSDGDKLQEILQTSDVKERLKMTLELLKQEIQTVKIQEKIQQQLDSKVNETQRKFYLNEQLKIIKKELGLETDEKTTLVEKFKERLEKKKVPEKVQKVIDEEITKFQSLEPASSEYNICRTYLDWLTIIPWGIYQKDNFDLKNAKKVLDKDHYGLKRVKERILEFLAVGKLKGNVQGKIICFVGPPGTGKTSIGKSIAAALGREYFRFSVGGVTDVNEIKGHRRTYIGAMPGKLIQIMKQAKTANPLVLIDEIDKMGHYHGDPSAALLEALDPEQNTTFMDHYLDVPVDLSKVLFLCTANILDTISGPLLDRMEIIRLAGYIEEEKVAIAQQYLIPKSLEENGLKKKQVRISEPALSHLIRYYCRESGVRNLKNQIDKLMRKAAYKFATGRTTAMLITQTTVKKFLGPPIFTDDRFFHRPPVGTCMGLAWTSMGGSTLYIETSAEENKNGGLQLTGKLGDVMKESSSIGYTFAKKFYHRHSPHGNFFNNHFIHLHVPEGATPKDGPSAGVTMVTAFLSLAFNTPVRPDIAMTGELTLSGKVLEIGGVKEKTIAAKRSGITRILFPKSNKKDWQELDSHVKKGIEATFADTYEDVFVFAFGLKTSSPHEKIINEGSWTEEEQQVFSEAYQLYGAFKEPEKWYLIAEYVRTRDANQVEDYFKQLTEEDVSKLPEPRMSPSQVLKSRGITLEEIKREVEKEADEEEHREEQV